MDEWSNYWPALTSNFLVCGLGLGLSFLVIRRARRLLLLPLAMIAFLLTNGLFQAVPLFVAVDVPFPTAPLLYARSAAAHGILVAVACLPLLVLCSVKLAPSEQRPAQVPVMVPMALVGLSVAAVSYFVWRNHEIISMSLAIYRTGSYVDYIAARNAVGEMVMTKIASGNGLASLTIAFLGPAGLALIPQARSLSAGVRRLLRGVAWLTMVIPAILIGARMMLVFTVVYPLLLWSFGRQSGHSLMTRLRESWKRVLSWMTCLIIGVAVFQSAVKSTVLEAAFLLGSRIFVAPGAVSGGYYLLFPDFFPFRGPAGIFMMPVASDKVDFNMISLAATGFDSHANASFLATAYSASGYAGVLIVSVLLVLGCLAVDLLLLRLHRRLASLITLSNLFGILVVGSVAFRVSVVTHGLLVGPAFVLLLIGLVRQCSRSPREAKTGGSLEVRIQHG
jgi:hypothetical protein